MRIYPPEFEKRSVEVAKKATDDIVECRDADVSVHWAGAHPRLRFVFESIEKRGGPALFIDMIGQSSKDPLGPGRLVEGDWLKRVVRDTIESYLKLNGITITKRILENAHV